MVVFRIILVLLCMGLGLCLSQKVQLPRTKCHGGACLREHQWYTLGGCVGRFSNPLASQSYPYRSYTPSYGSQRVRRSAITENSQPMRDTPIPHQPFNQGLQISEPPTELVISEKRLEAIMKRAVEAALQSHRFQSDLMGHQGMGNGEYIYEDFAEEPSLAASAVPEREPFHGHSTGIASSGIPESARGNQGMMIPNQVLPAQQQQQQQQQHQHQQHQSIDTQVERATHPALLENISPPVYEGYANRAEPAIPVPQSKI